MTKSLFENVYLLSAKLKDEVKKEGDKWVPTGVKKMEIMFLADVIDSDLKTGVVKYVSSIKEPTYDINQLITKLHRFDKLNILAINYEYADRIDYKFTKIECDGVDLTSMSTMLTPTDDGKIPF